MIFSIKQLGSFTVQILLVTLGFVYPCSGAGTNNAKSTKLRSLTDEPVLSLGIVVFPGYQPLDVWGPLDMFYGISQLKNITLSIISHNIGSVSTRSPDSDTNLAPLEVHIMATHNFSNAPPLDVLLVPGGIGNRALENNNDTAIASFVASRFQEVAYVLSVCTGAKHLAMSGVLEGRRATTNKSSWNSVVKFGNNVSWIPTARWTQDGKIWTSSGVSAGMDMTYAFLKYLFGEEEAGYVLRGMEYAPHTDPDWDPFSIVWNVPGADQGGSIDDCVRPVGY